MRHFEESRLEFSFGKQWQPIIDFDGHPDYRKLSDTIENTKGVDFVGVFADELNEREKLYLIEVKNFRHHRLDNNNKERLNSDELATELGQKVRNSLFCILSSYRTGDSRTWQPFLKMLVDR
ncbi:MAG: hypothetical protein U9Q70_11975, partial [Chloroflexota bacterium]|nr:hypothetical protein [Chloroflexota bacterium]